MTDPSGDREKVDQQHPFNGRRLNLYKTFWLKTFGERVQKIPVNAGFSCPNRDGTISKTGCGYCLNEAFSPFYCKPEKPVERQLTEGISFFRKKYKAKKFIAYFQAFSNTHAPVGQLAHIYSAALDIPGVVGLVIATRPDCLDEKKLELLARLQTRAYIGIELGIESCLDSTLARINRGHTFTQAVSSLNLARAFKIPVNGHLILGLPGETREDHLQTADRLSSLPLHALKIHHLQILQGTPLGDEYQRHQEGFPTFTIEAYIDLLTDFLERLNPKIMIDRLGNQSPRRLLLSPLWGGLKNGDLLRLVEKSLENRLSHQGKNHKPEFDFLSN